MAVRDICRLLAVLALPVLLMVLRDGLASAQQQQLLYLLTIPVQVLYLTAGAEYWPGTGPEGRWPRVVRAVGSEEGQVGDGGHALFG
jgi:hypothetical protein